MKILFVHNYYGSTAPSGENRVFEAEREMLRSAGYTVEVYTRHSDEIRVSEGGGGRWSDGIGGGVRWRLRKIWGLVKGAVCTIANPFAALALARKCREFKPEVVHFHNTFPLISPMAVWAASKYAPVVATLHNYRTVCAAGIPMRDGMVCVSCIEKRCICGAIKHKCYRGSLMATLPLVINIAIWRRVWNKCVTKFICLTPFAKEMMIKAGLPEDKIVVKGNSIEDVRNQYARTRTEGSIRVLYAGRMSDEKGPQVLIEAWNKMGKDAPELLMIGDGDERGRYEAMVKSDRIKFVGQKTREEVLQAVVDADVVVVPSLCYEGLPTNILEAFMLGRPCLVSNLGALPSIVKDGVSGWTFKADDAEDLIRAIGGLNKEAIEKRGEAARVEYEKYYTNEANVSAAELVYKSLRERRV